MQIDTSTANPARICRLYGTVAAKGDATSDRPHRPSRMLEAPAQPVVAPRALLERLAELAPADPHPGAHRSGQRFDVGTWLTQHSIAVARERAWQGGTLYELDGCPMDATHERDRAAYVVQHTSGAASSNGEASREGAEQEPWPEPTPLGPTRPGSSIPIDGCPKWQRSMVQAVARARSVPQVFTALYSLAIIAGAIAGKYAIQIRRGWVAPLTLWVFVALRSGERKTPTIDDLRRPLVAYERERQEERDKDRKTKLAELKVQRAVAEGAARRAGNPRKGDDPDEIHRAAARAALAVEEAEAALPPEYCLCSEYPTPEKLHMRMVAHQGRQIVLSDEGAGVLAMTGRYVKWGGANLDLLLHGCDGTSHRPDLVTRVTPPIRRALLSMALGMQPTVLQGFYREAPAFKERGFFARALLAFPESMVGYRKTGTPPVPTGVEKGYARRISSLLEIPETIDERGDLQPLLLTMSDDAEGAMREFEAWIEPQLRDGGDLQRVTEWTLKLAGNVARLAGLIHIAWHAGERQIPLRVELATVEAAIAIGKALVPHAHAVEDLLELPPDMRRGQRLLRWLRSHVRPGEDGRYVFSVRQAHDSLRRSRGFESRPDLDAPLLLLEEHGNIRPLAHETRVGRPTEQYEVNPAVWTSPLAEEGEAAEPPDGEPDFADCADIAGTSSSSSSSTSAEPAEEAYEVPFTGTGKGSRR